MLHSKYFLIFLLADKKYSAERMSRAEAANTVSAIAFHPKALLLNI
jgi:hypothetical protein